MDFLNKFHETSKANKSLLCVGLDPELDKIPGKISIFSFNKKIIDSTFDMIAAYKPNIAFYEAYGIDGLKELKKTIDYLKKRHPYVPIILDAKRADIPNTAKMYAKSAYEYWQADALTVYPNLGLDSVGPFLKYRKKLTILLLKTSNKDSARFQNIKTAGQPYFLKIAQEINKWKQKNIGLFCGATYPLELGKLRKISPNRFFLSAGLGAQKADIKKVVINGVDKNKSGIVFNVSRSIIYSKNPRYEAQKIRDEINKYRNI